MDAKESLRRYGLVPSDEALPHIRTLLANEVALERKGRGHERESDLALLCCVQLFSRGLLEDVLRIWDAKRSGMDLGSLLDIQFLCGAGLDETKRFLSSQAGVEAAKALKYLGACERTGDFVGFVPETHLANYRRYFDVK
jgi:hypothetical protein